MSYRVTQIPLDAARTIPERFWLPSCYVTVTRITHPVNVRIGGREADPMLITGPLALYSGRRPLGEIWIEHEAAAGGMLELLESDHLRIMPGARTAAAVATGTGDASFAEQQTQTGLLGDIETALGQLPTIAARLAALAGVLPVPAFAFESLAVSTVAVALDDAEYGDQAGTVALVQVQDAAIRATWHGGADPTAAVGALYSPGDIIPLLTLADIENFRAIRAGESDATLAVHYARP